MLSNRQYALKHNQGFIVVAGDQVLRVRVESAPSNILAAMRFGISPVN
jgi:hypothetical protein